MQIDHDVRLRMRDALRKGKLRVIEELLAQGFPVNGPVLIVHNGEGGTHLLHEAASAGQIDACKLLLDRGADPNTQVFHGGLTPLHCALHLQHHGKGSDTHLEMCRLLLSHGANPNVPKVAMDWTALHEAIDIAERVERDKAIGQWSAGKDLDDPMAIIDLLIESGARLSFTPDRKNGSNWSEYLTPFQLAVRKGLVAYVREFIENHGMNPHEKTQDGRTLVRLTKDVNTKSYLKAAKISRAVHEAMGFQEEAPSAAPSQSRSFSPL